MSDMFPQHPRSGDWETLKGRMLAPHELGYDVEDKNLGDARFNGTVNSSGGWSRHTIVTTGMTHGGGAMAK